MNTIEPVKKEVVTAPPPVVKENVVKKAEEVKKETRIYTGMATYYADNYQGQRTASGEPYDKNKYTTAVRFNTIPLPYGTMVEVFSVKRNKKVIVKVNDIMGNNSSAVIDLSYKAAEEIGLNIDGRTPVTVRVIEEGGN
jgi:rare lipoprotein A